MKRRTRKKKQLSPLYMIMIYTLAVLFLEIVFQAATTETVFTGIVYKIMFSFAYGTVGYILCSLFKKRKINEIITHVWLGATTVIYIVQYLIYKQFKQFYDINTMTGGAGDALTSYFGELMHLIFIQGGLFIMALMCVPFVANLLWGKRVFAFNGISWRNRAMSAATGAMVHILVMLFVLLHPVNGPVYNKQYNFQSAVSTFGLVTGLRLDVQHGIAPADPDFEHTGIPVIPDVTDPESTEPGATEPTEIVYGDNAIDLDTLMQKSANSKIKKLNDYVKTLTPSKKNQYTGLFKGKNLIFLTAEAFSGELIDKDLTPTLYRLANKGIQFTDYYQPASAGTTGGEYQNMFGMLPTAGGKSFKNAASNYNYYTVGNCVGEGYYGKAYHNNSYTYYDRNKTHTKIGYSDGFMGRGNGMEEFVQKKWPQSDFEMISGTFETYVDKQPFNIYYMTVSGHSNYGKSGNAMTKRHWDRVQHLPYSDQVKGYFACNLDLEDGLAHLVKRLEEEGIADDTVIVLSTDHFPYGLDSDAALGNMPYLSELYGYNVDDYFKRDHNRLIIWSGCLEKMDPIVVDAPTFGLDILPTLYNLFGTEFDSRLMVGRDVLSDAPALVFNTNYDWKTEYGTYYAKNGKFVPKDPNIELPEDYVKTMKAVVKNKRSYCAGVLDNNYYKYLFK
ncbi:MAG: sulfatase-like hydrolase/transferase [Oscillospiraceae bacterium]|nr:sulfatase-like hydrolase/transferase [Oscillospiraceae bacterium]